MFSLNKIKNLLEQITKKIGNYIIQVLKWLKKSTRINNNLSPGYMDTISENQLENLRSFEVFDDLVRKFYKKEELKALEELDYNSKNSAVFFSEIVQSKEPLHDFEYHTLKC